MRRYTNDYLEAMARRLGELVVDGYAKPGQRVAEGEINATTAYQNETGINPGTLRRQLREITKRGLDSHWKSPGPAATPAEPTRAEVHDAAFWKKKCAGLQKALDETEHVLAQISGIAGAPFSIPDWLIDGNGHVGKSVLIAHTSDWHLGEVIDPEEIQGVNEFNVSICRARLERYFSAACTVGERWASDTDCQGVLLTLAGDLISGNIHQELAETNELTSNEQCLAAAEVGAAGIKVLADRFGRVHVIVVAGNHGRQTPKTTAKMSSRMSYDILIGQMLQKQFSLDKRVSFQFGRSKDQVVPVFGRSILVTHGDRMGSGGGMGFAGPILPIVRGTKKISAQQASLGRQPDLILHGHYHVTANPGNVLSNGSVVGYSEFADDIRASVEPPMQWLALFHSRWGLRERAPIQLEDPVLPEKPVVRVPAGWEVS